MPTQDCIHGFSEGCIRCAMADPGYRIPVTLISLIVDCSGSMSQRLTASLDGLNEYLNSLRGHENIQYLLTLTTFGNDTEIVFRGVPLQDIPKLTGSKDPQNSVYKASHLKIRGCTALYDAVGETIEATEKELGHHPGASVLFQVITDGEENASTGWNKKKVGQAVKRTTETGNWTYTFVGCDIDAWTEASDMGLSAGNTKGVKAASYGSTFAVLTNATTVYASARSAAFTKSVSLGVKPCDAKFAVSNYFSGGDQEAADASETVASNSPKA